MNDKVYVKIRGLSAQEAGDAYKEAEDIEIISVVWSFRGILYNNSVYKILS